MTLETFIFSTDKLSLSSLTGGTPSNELQMYTWQDASLKELEGLVKEVNPEARRRGTYFDFALVYPDLRQGPRCQTRDLGTTIASQKVSQITEQYRDMSSRNFSSRGRMTARLFTIASLSSETTLTWQSLHLREEWIEWTMVGGASEIAGTDLVAAAAETMAATAGDSVEAAVVAEISGLRGMAGSGADLAAAAERGRSETTGTGGTERGSRGMTRRGNILKSL